MPDTRAEVWGRPADAPRKTQEMGRHFLISKGQSAFQQSQSVSSCFIKCNDSPHTNPPLQLRSRALTYPSYELRGRISPPCYPNNCSRCGKLYYGRGYLDVFQDTEVTMHAEPRRFCSKNCRLSSAFDICDTVIPGEAIYVENVQEQVGYQLLLRERQTSRGARGYVPCPTLF